MAGRRYSRLPTPNGSDRGPRWNSRASTGVCPGWLATQDGPIHSCDGYPFDSAQLARCERWRDQPSLPAAPARRCHRHCWSKAGTVLPSNVLSWPRPNSGPCPSGSGVWELTDSQPMAEAHATGTTSPHGGRSGGLCPRSNFVGVQRLGERSGSTSALSGCLGSVVSRHSACSVFGRCRTSDRLQSEAVTCNPISHEETPDSAQMRGFSSIMRRNPARSSDQKISWSQPTSTANSSGFYWSD